MIQNLFYFRGTQTASRPCFCRNQIAFRGRAPGYAVELGAAFAALVFAGHPLRVESVAWITERRDVLSGVWYLLAVWAWLRAVAEGDGIRPGFYALSLGGQCALYLLGGYGA